MKIVKGILIVLGIVFVCLFVYGFVNESVTGDSVAPSYKEGYMEGCMSEGGNKQYCRCTLDYIDESISNKEFYAISDRISEDDSYYPEIMKEAVFECIDLF